MNYKRYLTTIIAFTLCLFLLSGTAALGYSDSTTRIKNFGILDISGRESAITTKGDFTKAIVIASGYEDEAHSSAGATIFSDIQAGSQLSGYVNVAVEKGLMVGAVDGKYHPEYKMNFAQVCTILVKALGYSDADVSGMWPKNFISKAKELGIADGVNLGNMDGVPMWAAASMIDRLLDTKVKKANAGDADVTFAEKSGLSSESYQYAAIANPVYSKPEVARGVTNLTSSIGSIDLVTGNPVIIKDGKPINIRDIEDNDVVYQVSDAWNTKRYILVVDNKVQGKITSISPSQIGIDGQTYVYGQGMDFNNALSSYDNLKVDDYATVLLGYDGKVVDFFNIGHQDNSGYAFVVNYYLDVNVYKVKLLMIDGNVREFKADAYPGEYKGRLVAYSKKDYETVSLKGISYSSTGGHIIDKDLRKIDTNYVANNIRIFNLVNDDVKTSEDVDIELVDWADMPSGKIDSGKILYINEVGDYNDVNVMVVNDIFGDRHKTGIVKKRTPVTSHKFVGVDSEGNPQYQDVVTGYNYTIVVDGADKTWNNGSSSYATGEAINVDVINGQIDAITGSKYRCISGEKFSAVDLNRVQLNGESYYLKNNVVVYFETSDGNYVLKSIKDIEAGKQYRKVSVYLDKAIENGGKVDTIIVEQ